MKSQLVSLGILGLWVSLALGTRPDPAKDHLVRADILFDHTNPVAVAYREVIQRKLCLTPADIARFIQLPGATNPETVVSVYRVDGHNDRYKVTCTQSSSSLWETVQHPGGPTAKSASRIKVIRCDAELPAYLAQSIHQIWLKMLADVTPESIPHGVVYLDGTTEIFTAVKANKKGELEGRAPYDYPKNGKVSALISLAFSLQAYCDPPPEGRDAVSAELLRAVKEFPDK